MTDEQLIRKWKITGFIDEYDNVINKLELATLLESTACELHGRSHSPDIFFNEELTPLILPICVCVYRHNYTPDPKVLLNQVHDLRKLNYHVEEMEFIRTFVNKFYPIKTLTLEESNYKILADMARN